MIYGLSVLLLIIFMEAGSREISISTPSKYKPQILETPRSRSSWSHLKFKSWAKKELVGTTNYRVLDRQEEKL
jgi:hypothetical protein